MEDAKVRDYLLNLAHPDGGSKAIWFHSLGYDRDAAIGRDRREFSAAILLSTVIVVETRYHSFLPSGGLPCQGSF